MRIHQEQQFSWGGGRGMGRLNGYESHKVREMSGAPIKEVSMNAPAPTQIIVLDVPIRTDSQYPHSLSFGDAQFRPLSPLPRARAASAARR